MIDSAYDAGEIIEHTRELGSCADRRARKPMRKYIPFQGIQPSRTFSWAEAERFREPTMVERVYGRLKGEFGGRDIRVRGHRIEQLDESGTLFPPPDRI